MDNPIILFIIILFLLSIAIYLYLLAKQQKKIPTVPTGKKYKCENGYCISTFDNNGNTYDDPTCSGSCNMTNKYIVCNDKLNCNVVDNGFFLTDYCEKCDDQSFNKNLLKQVGNILFDGQHFSPKTIFLIQKDIINIETHKRININFNPINYFSKFSIQMFANYEFPNINLTVENETGEKYSLPLKTDHVGKNISGNITQMYLEYNKN